MHVGKAFGIFMLLLLGFLLAGALTAGSTGAETPSLTADPLAGLRPSPASAEKDRGMLHAAGCMAWAEDTASGRCTYGNPASDRRVVVFGDSRAMQYFDPLEPAAVRRNWRLVGLVRGNCLVAQVRYEKYCDIWRENSLRRIERAKPDLVIVGSATKSMYRVTRRPKQMSRPASQLPVCDLRQDHEAVAGQPTASRPGVTSGIPALRSHMAWQAHSR